MASTHVGSCAQVDYDGHVVRHIDMDSLVVSTLAGTLGLSGYADGVGLDASFNYPVRVTMDADATFALVVSPWSWLRLDLSSFSHTYATHTPTPWICAFPSLYILYLLFAGGWK